MKQETLEEVAMELWRNDSSMSDYVQQAYITAFKAGAKWQEEQDKQMQKEQIINALNKALKKYDEEMGKGL